MTRNTITALSLAGAAALAISFIPSNDARAAHHGHAAQPTQNIVQAAASNDQFSTLVAAVSAADLVGVLSGPGPFTVFAPNNEAFSALGNDTIQSLLEPEAKDTLTSVLTYHVVAGELDFAAIGGSTFLTTVQGQRLEIGVSDGALTVDGAKVIGRDLRTTNGIIHVIDTVMMPVTDNLAEVATGAGVFNTLVAAADAAGLVPALVGEGEYTVLAPTDDAFAKLGDEAIADLLKPENKTKLGNILKYHIIPGKRYADELFQARRFATILGPTVDFSGRGRNRQVNDARITSADIEASNGVIHVIDSVILPPDRFLSVAPQMNPDFEDPRFVIRLAIEKGAPLFNHHQPGACADIYEVALVSLLGRNDLKSSTKSTINTALSRGLDAHNDTDRAWAYRRGLDNAYEIIDNRMTMRRMATRDHH
ncbi:MAG: fasciclin domain-containing protein [Planctomycetota bacterium]